MPSPRKSSPSRSSHTSSHHNSHSSHKTQETPRKTHASHHTSTKKASAPRTVDADTKKMLKSKMETLYATHLEYQRLQKETSNLQGNAKERDKIAKALQEVNRSKLTAPDGTVARKKKAYQHLKPTMALTYEAVEKVLGANALLLVKKKLEELKHPSLKRSGSSSEKEHSKERSPKHKKAKAGLIMVHG